MAKLVVVVLHQVSPVLRIGCEQFTGTMWLGIYSLFQIQSPKVGGLHSQYK